ncbi:MAG: YdeI/OmpD-associated family protein [Pseudomonadota bacterium]
MAQQSEIPHLEVTSAEGLWTWLADNHDGPSVWLVTWKAAHPEKYVSRDEVLDALVAYGWIDGRRMKVDADRTKQLIAPRRQQAWARSYKARAERLIADGRMAAPGLATMQAGKDSGLWDWSDPVDDLEVPEDLRAALQTGGGANWFEAAAPSYRRNVLRFIAGAKRAETRAKRIAAVAGHAGRGEKLPQY